MSDPKWPMRMQVCVGRVLVAEVVTHAEVLSPFTPKNWVAEWYRVRCARGLAGGAVVVCDARLPRMWDVPVGSEVGGCS